MSQSSYRTYGWTCTLVIFEKKPSLSVLSIESLSSSEEDKGGQQMSPELLNKAFSIHVYKMMQEA